MNSSYSPPKISVSQLMYLQQISLIDYYVNDPESGTVCCKICKFRMPNDHVFEHTVSKRHKYNKLLVRIVNNSSYNGDIDFIIKDIDRLQCRYCNSLEISSNEDDLVVNHLRGFMHRFNKGNLTISSSSSGVDSDQCNMTLRPLDSLLTYDKNHENQIRNLSRNLPKPSVASVVVKVNTQPSSSYCGGKDTQCKENVSKCITVDENGICVCTVCDKYIPNTTVNINEHINGKAHKNQLQELQETADKYVESDCSSNSLQEPTDIDDSQSYWCKHCGTKIPNNEYNIEQHNSGRNHQSKIKALLVSTEATEHKVKDKVEDPIKIMHDLCFQLQQFAQDSTNKSEIASGSSEKIKKKLTMISKLAANKNEQGVYSDQIDYFIQIDGTLACKICRKTIPNVSDIHDHITSKKHQRNVLKGDQRLSGYENKEDLFVCPICDKIYQKGTKSAHINSKKHQRKVSKIPSSSNNMDNEPYFAFPPHIIFVDGSYACNICRLLFTDIYFIDDHVASVSHKQNLLKKTQLLPGYENPETLWGCKICNKLIPKHFRSAHVNGSKHQQQTVQSIFTALKLLSPQAH